MTVFVERDSVTMGDDVAAPHRIAMEVQSDATLAQILDLLRKKNYLPGIMGDRATWIVELNRPLAVVAEQWNAPRFLCDPQMKLADSDMADGSTPLFFRYWCQVEPDRVFEALQTDRPLPDMFGRN